VCVALPDNLVAGHRAAYWLRFATAVRNLVVIVQLSSNHTLLGLRYHVYAIYAEPAAAVLRLTHWNPSLGSMGASD
jgi:hypothetical protein